MLSPFPPNAQLVALPVVVVINQDEMSVDCSNTASKKKTRHKQQNSTQKAKMRVFFSMNVSQREEDKIRLSNLTSHDRSDLTMIKHCVP